MTKFTYAELFAGILGFGTALDDLGGEPVFISEIDKYAQTAIRALGRGDLLHGDITKIDAADVPDHDLLVGGFPCQAFSVAGKRLGFEDMRGTLFFEAVRIAKEKRPKALLLENVKGLVSHAKGDTISVMLHALNDIGYVVDMKILNSKFFGVPQNRERIFIVAIREDLADVAEWTDIEGKDSFPKTKRRLQEEGLVTFNFDWPPEGKVTKRLRDVLETEVDEKYYLAADKVEKLVAALDDGKGLAIREATKKGYAMAEPGDAVNFQFPDSKTRRGRVGKQIANTLEASNINQGVVEQLTIFDFEEAARESEPEAVQMGAIWGNDRQAGRMWDVNGLSPALRTASGGYNEPIIDEAAARHAEPTVRKVGNTNPSGQGMNGNVYSVEAGICPTLTTNKGEGTKVMEARAVMTPDIINKAQNGRRFKEDGEESFTLTAQDRHGVALGAYPEYRIRKLTPRETWRLQAFSDAAFDKVKAAGISDTQLYKQAGNAVTVNVIRAIAEKLLPFLN